MATLGLSAADKAAVEDFKRDVIEPSMTQLVIIDFWADWSAPSKALTPVLETVAADYAAKGVILRRINVDENKLIAAQFRIQTLPTIYAVFQGQPVADLTSARTEAQLGKMLDQLLKQLPIAGEAQSLEAEIAPLIAMGEEVLAAGDAARALGVFVQLRDMAPEHPDVRAGLIRAHVAAGDVAAAEAEVATLSAEQRKDPAITRALAAVALAKEAKPVDDLSGLIAKVAADPLNKDARFELAGGLMAAGDKEGAADHLLSLIEQDRDWNEGAARALLLKLFEVVGLTDPWVSAQRRRLSAVLFT